MDNSRSHPSIADGQKSSEAPESVFDWLKRRITGRHRRIRAAAGVSPRGSVRAGSYNKRARSGYEKMLKESQEY